MHGFAGRELEALGHTLKDRAGISHRALLSVPSGGRGQVTQSRLLPHVVHLHSLHVPRQLLAQCHGRASGQNLGHPPAITEGQSLELTARPGCLPAATWHPPLLGTVSAMQEGQLGPKGSAEHQPGPEPFRPLSFPCMQAST